MTAPDALLCKPGLSRWAWYNPKSPSKREAGVLELHMTKEVEDRERERIKDAMLLVLKMEERARSQRMRWPLEAKKGKGLEFLLGLQKKCNPSLLTP